jgi:hypothetical protein
LLLDDGKDSEIYLRSLPNGTVNNPAGTAAIESTPNNLFGKTLNRLNVGRSTTLVRFQEELQKDLLAHKILT